jgi:hypothetical protein
MSKDKGFSQALNYITGANSKEEEIKEEKVVKEEVKEVTSEPKKEITKVDFTENRTKSFSMVLRPSMLYLIKKYSKEHDISMSKVVEKAICQYLDI